MKTFAWTSLIRIIVILGAWIYMTNFQSDALYNFLNISNPATNAVKECMTEVADMQSGASAQLQSLSDKLDTILSGNTANTNTGSNNTVRLVVPASTGSTATGTTTNTVQLNLN